MFGAVKLVRNAIKCKFAYNCIEIAFDEESLWNFDNDYVRNVVIYGVGNSSSSHLSNPKINFFVLGKWTTFGINGTHRAGEKKLY